MLGFMKNIFILEDDEITLSQLVIAINASEKFQVVGSAMTIRDAHTTLGGLTPDLLLLDLQLPDGESFELIRRYTDDFPDRPILVFSVFGDESRVIEAIKAGARGYLLKGQELTGVLNAFTAALSGQSPISPAIAAHLVNQFQTKSADETIESPLSEREMETLQLAAKGLTYKEIAELLDVKVSTVATYTMRTYTKLAVNSRAEALFEARKLGLMQN